MQSSAAAPTAVRPRRRHIWAYVLALLVAAIVVVVALWDWDWFLPIVNAQASSALGRKTTVEHLDVKLGRTTTVILSGVKVENADGLGDGKPFADIGKLTVLADVMAYVHNRQIVIPQIIVDQPVIEADADAEGKASWTGLGGSSKPEPAGKQADPNAGPKIGQLVIHDGKAHVAMAKLRADFNLAVSTRSAEDAPAAQHDKAANNGGQIVVDAKGTYAAQPILGQFIGGALLSLRDTANPYPVDLHLANGPTKVSLTGTLQNPLNFAGADLKLEFSGPNAALLTPLTAVPIPETPPYSIAGGLDIDGKKIKFEHFTGRLGSSDLNGEIDVDPTQAKPFVEANLFSRQVDLKDLAGFIGGTPGHANTPGAAPAQRAEVARAEASPKLLPDTPINLPKLNAANVRLRYKGEHILGRDIPLDDIVANVDITDGRIVAKPISFAVGTGTIAINTDLAPVNAREFKTDTNVQFKKLDVGKLLGSTGLVKGTGAVSGAVTLVSTGNSFASLVGHGNGGFEVGMAGGNLSALIVDLAGLEFGNALLSALGVPDRAQIQCFAINMPLRNGVLNTQRFLLDTTEARVQGNGSIDLNTETLNYAVEATSKNFSVGSFRTPINLTGTFRKPSIAPAIGPLAVKAGAAVGLGVLFPPAAILPTVQFGIKEDGACEQAEAPIAAKVNAAAGTHVVGPATRRVAPRRTVRRPGYRHP